MYDIEPHIAEVYDQHETFTDDVALIRNLVVDRGRLRILEPFCGTGRILIPLALDGHELVGLDQARGMLAWARGKVGRLPREVQGRIALLEADVTAEEWPRGFDVVILGGNCFYELATAAEQEKCIVSAAASLNAGGRVYVDNDHMESDLDASWQVSGTRSWFPTGTCSDGTAVESTMQTVWFDASRRLARFRRVTKVTLPDGNTAEREYVQQKHPVSAVEVRAWLKTHGFTVEQVYGDRSGSPYTEGSPRAIFWAVKH
jgi:SAM-dependent methyltransferase